MCLTIGLIDRGRVWILFGVLVLLVVVRCWFFLLIVTTILPVLASLLTGC